MKQKEILIYQCYLCEIGGVETFLYNLCLNLRNYYDVKVLYSDGDRKQIKRLNKLVELVKYDKDKQYECDIFIRNSVWGHIPENIKSRENRYIEMRHANYKFLLDKGVLYDQYHPSKLTNEIVACGDYVAEMSDEVLHDKPYTIKNILAPKKETKPILHLITCARLDKDKGVDRMKKLIDMMRSAGIKFDWKIYTNNKPTIECEDVHYYRPKFDIFDELASSTYTVLLSDSEGLPYTIQESLQYKVPCIVTDVGGCTELIKDGVNGYVVPLDMDFDINKILKVPKLNEYDNGALKKWLDYLGNSVYVEKEVKEDMYKLKALMNFTYNKYDEIIDLQPINQVRKGYVYAGDILTIDNKEEVNYLCGNNASKLIACELLEEVKEEPKLEEKIEEIKKVDEEKKIEKNKFELKSTKKSKKK